MLLLIVSNNVILLISMYWLTYRNFVLCIESGSDHHLKFFSRSIYQETDSFGPCFSWCSVIFNIWKLWKVRILLIHKPEMNTACLCNIIQETHNFSSPLHFSQKSQWYLLFPKVYICNRLILVVGTRSWDNERRLSWWWQSSSRYHQ